MSDERLTEFELRRLEVEPDNTVIKPRDILLAAVHDIDNGDLLADGVCLVFVSRPTDPAIKRVYSYYRAGMSRPEEIIAYDVAHNYFLNGW